MSWFTLLFFTFTYQCCHLFNAGQTGDLMVPCGQLEACTRTDILPTTTPPVQRCPQSQPVPHIDPTTDLPCDSSYHPIPTVNLTKHCLCTQWLTSLLAMNLITQFNPVIDYHSTVGYKCRPQKKVYAESYILQTVKRGDWQDHVCDSPCSRIADLTLLPSSLGTCRNPMQAYRGICSHSCCTYAWHIWCKPIKWLFNELKNDKFYFLNLRMLLW